MIIISGICSSVLLVILIQAALIILQEPYGLNFVQHNKLIISKSVVLVSAGTVVMVLLLHILKWNHYSLPEMILNVVLLWCMAVLTVTDHKIQIIPNQFLKVLLIIDILILGIYCLVDIEGGLYLSIQCVLGGVISGIVFFVCYFLSKSQLGAGDVKLAMIIGLYLGAERALDAFLYGTVICCVYSLVQVARKRLSWKDGVPMVPFLTLGVWMILLIN